MPVARFSMRSPWARTLIASSSTGAVFFTYASFADTESRSALLGVAALATGVVSMAIAFYVVLLVPRLGRLLAAAVCSLGVFFVASTAAWVSPACPAADGLQRCSALQSVAAGFSVMLLVPAAIGMVFTAAVSVRIARSIVQLFRTRVMHQATQTPQQDKRSRRRTKRDRQS